jgi:hypothetical protein
MVFKEAPQIGPCLSTVTHGIEPDLPSSSRTPCLKDIISSTRSQNGTQCLCKEFKIKAI